MNSCLSHLELPQDVHWSWMVLAGLFDWSLVRLVCFYVGVCVCTLPHLAVGRTLDWELRGPAVRSHPHALAQLLLEATWGQRQCFPVLAAVRKREDQTWRGIAKIWCRSLREGGRSQQRNWWAKQVELCRLCRMHSLLFIWELLTVWNMDGAC